MNRNRYSSLLFGVLALSLILFGTPSGAFAYHTGSESDLAANPELVVFRNFGGGSVDTLALNPELALFRGYAASDSRGGDADSARWVAKGIFYSGVMVGALPPDSIRRSSLGFYYAEKLAKLQRDREDAAMVSFPSEAAAIDYFLAKLRATEADSARWAALGDVYLARGRDADSTRWAALGAQFAGVMAGIPDVDVIGAFHADEARLAALDVYFKALVARGGGTDVLGALYASRFLADNELIAAACSFDDLALNPELSVARSYEDLASNPELLALQQYATGRC
jgi:hypothetical protein